MISPIKIDFGNVSIIQTVWVKNIKKTNFDKQTARFLQKNRAKNKVKFKAQVQSHKAWCLYLLCDNLIGSISLLCQTKYVCDKSMSQL